MRRLFMIAVAVAICGTASQAWASPPAGFPSSFSVPTITGAPVAGPYHFTWVEDDGGFYSYHGDGFTGLVTQNDGWYLQAFDDVGDSALWPAQLSGDGLSFGFGDQIGAGGSGSSWAITPEPGGATGGALAAAVGLLRRRRRPVLS